MQSHALAALVHCCAGHAPAWFAASVHPTANHDITIFFAAYASPAPLYHTANCNTCSYLVYTRV